MFVKFFYALYERILMARLLVEEKVGSDLAEIPEGEKVKLKLIDEKTGVNDEEIVKQMVDERFELFLKGVFSLTNQATPTSSS